MERVGTTEHMAFSVQPSADEPLVEAVKEVTHTVLTNPGFFAADKLDDVRRWVRKLFPGVRHEVFEGAFFRVVLDPDVPWGRRRFAVRRGAGRG